MIDDYTIQECKRNKEVRAMKIKSLEHAIKESRGIINESRMDKDALSFLRRKIANSIQELEILYLMNEMDD